MPARPTRHRSKRQHPLRSDEPVTSSVTRLPNPKPNVLGLPYILRSRFDAIAILTPACHGHSKATCLGFLEDMRTGPRMITQPGFTLMTFMRRTCSRGVSSYPFLATVWLTLV